MAWNPYNADRFGLPETQEHWIKRYPWREGGAQLHTYIFGESIGLDPNPPRFPLNPNDVSRLLTRWSAADTVRVMTSAFIDHYKGITMEPKLVGSRAQVVEKNAKVILPLGSENVTNEDFVMCDDNPQFGELGTDVIPQYYTKQWTFAAHTAITAAVDLLAGYVAGTTVIQIDTISVAFALNIGQTISITTGGVAAYYLIKDINYALPTAAGTDAIITLAWGLAAAIVNNDVISTVHIASQPIYFQFGTEFYENLKEIELCVQHDVSIPDADVLPIVAYAAAGIAANTVAIVPSGGFTHPGGARGGIGLQLGTVLDTGDIVVLTARFYDKIIRQRTVGFAATSGTARTSATATSQIKVELK